MKKFGYTASILKDTNHVISTSQSDWSTVKENDYFRIGEDVKFYNIDRSDKIFYIKDFKTTNERTIITEDEVSINLSKNDLLTITYKEYKLLTVLEIKNIGRAYKIGDILTINGGILSRKIEDDSTQSTKIKIKKVNEEGGIVDIAIEQFGLYTQPPPKLASTRDGCGADAIFELEYIVSDNRKLIERQILSINRFIVPNLISLNFPLPEGINEGKISVIKWEIFLKDNYKNEENQLEKFYDIASNFTSNIKLPLLMLNSMQTELIFNNAMEKIDLELAELKKEIKQLKGITS